MNLFFKASFLVKATALLCAVTLLLFIIAYSSRGWLVGLEEREKANNISNLHIGLWKTCYDDVKHVRVCGSTKSYLREGWNEDWLPAVQVFFSLSLVLNIVVVIEIVTYMTLSLLHEYGIMPIFLAICILFTTIALTFLGVLIFGIQHSFDYTNFFGTALDWCFPVMIICLCFNAISCLLLLVELYDLLTILFVSKMKRQEQKVLDALEEARIRTRNSNYSNNIQALDRAESSPKSSDTKNVNENNTVNESTPMSELQDNETVKIAESGPKSIDIQNSCDANLTTHKHLYNQTNIKTTEKSATPTHLFQTTFESAHVAAPVQPISTPLPPVHLFHAKPNCFTLPPLGPITIQRDRTGSSITDEVNKSKSDSKEIKGPLMKNSENEMRNSTPANLFITKNSGGKDQVCNERETMDVSKSTPFDLFVTKRSDSSVVKDNNVRQSVPVALFSAAGESEL